MFIFILKYTKPNLFFVIVLLFYISAFIVMKVMTLTTNDNSNSNSNITITNYRFNKSIIAINGDICLHYLQCYGFRICDYSSIHDVYL